MKLNLKLKRSIWECEWPENISARKLGKALNVSPQRAQEWISNKTIPDAYVPLVSKLQEKDLLQENS